MPEPSPVRPIFMADRSSVVAVGGPVEGEPFEIGFGESECLAPFADDEERARNEDWRVVSCPGDLNGRGN